MARRDQRTYADIAPMLATPAAQLPRGDGWAFELKWDGVRAVAHITDGSMRLMSRNGRDITARYPELQQLASANEALDCVLDGEVVALMPDGRPSFELLQTRMHVDGASPVAVCFMIFDVLALGGELLIDKPYAQRRAILGDLHLDGPFWRSPPHDTGVGDRMLEFSRSHGIEGVVAKQLDSVYTPGRRTPAWRKVKNTMRQEFVVGGFTAGERGRAGTIGALLLGCYDDRGALHYAGRVGTGFSQTVLEELSGALARIVRHESPFCDGDIPREARFVEPVIVAEVRFSEWTRAGVVRQPSFLGIRTDKPPTDIRREQF